MPREKYIKVAFNQFSQLYLKTTPTSQPSQSRLKALVININPLSLLLQGDLDAGNLL